MKYFICAVEKANLAISAEQTERIIQVARPQTSVCESINNEVFISIPALFRQNDLVAPHGLVLKTSLAGGRKTILLTPRIDIDLEIPEENIHRLPEIFAGVFSFIRGVFFNGTNRDMILVLDPVKLGEVYHD